MRKNNTHWEEICLDIEESMDIEPTVAYLEETLFKGKLQKVPEHQMNQPLHHNIGLITYDVYSELNKVDQGIATGFLISSNIVLTTAHTVIDQIPSLAHIKFKFHPGLCGQLGNGIGIEDHFVPEQYKSKRCPKYDYALLKLSKHVQRRQFIALSGDVQKMKKIKSDKSEAEIALFGYPYVKRQGKVYQWGLKMRRALNKIREQEKQLIYLMSSQRGQSGSPLYLIQQGRLTIIGIHAGCIETNGKAAGNVARMITPEFIKQLQQRVKKMEGSMFKIYPQQNPPEKQSCISAQQCVKKGLNLHKAKLYDRAIEMYSKAIKIKKDYAAAYYHLGITMKTLKRQNDAVMEKFQKTVQIDPKFSHAYFNMGVIYHEMNQKQKAIDLYNQAIKLNPSYAQAYNNIGAILDDMNQKEKAEQYLLEAIKINPQYTTAHNNLGIVYYDLNKKESAEFFYQKAIKIDPKHKEVINNLGIVYFDWNYQQKAVKCFRQAIEIDYNFSNPYFNWIDLVSNRQSAEKPWIFFNQIKRSHPNCQIVYKALEKLQEKIKKYR